MICCPLGKDHAFKQTVARQTIFPVDAVAAGLSHGIKVIHSCLRIAVYMDATHKIMLCRDNRNRLLCDIIARLFAGFKNMWEMEMNLFV